MEETETITETETEDRNPYQLAQLADVTSPDSPTSPGAEWLLRVASDAEDLWDYGKNETEIQDTISEYADQAVPMYTHHRWEVFVDLAAYQEEVTEFGPVEDMTAAAGVALYMIAERLLNALIEEKREEAEEEEDEDEDEDEDTEEDEDGTAEGEPGTPLTYDEWYAANTTDTQKGEEDEGV
jgi:hypothetical protein